jgi:hypothetical protein
MSKNQDSKPLQLDQFNFDSLRDNLNKMEQDIVRALQFLDIDERNISASTLEIATDLKGHSSYYESKRLEKRKQIEEKFKVIEAQRDEEIQAALKNRRTFHSDHSNTSDIHNESQRRVGERTKSQAKMDDILSNPDRNPSVLMDRLEEINKDLGVAGQEARENDTEGDERSQTEGNDDDREMMTSQKSFNEVGVKKEPSQNALIGTPSQKKTERK